MVPEDNHGALPPLVVFSPNRWEESWTSRHRIATGLAARGWPVMYNSGPLSTWERRSESWTKAPILGGIRRENGLLVDVPGRIEAYWPRSPIWTQIAVRRHARRLRRTVCRETSRQQPFTAFLFHPRYWPEAQALKPERIVYFAYDAISLAPGWTEEQAGLERALVARADLIVAYSRNMFDYMPQRAAQIGREIPTGVDIEHFVGALAEPCPKDLALIPRPRIGYTGNINQKLDLLGMYAVARAAPELNFVFVGPAGPGNGGNFPGHPVETQAWEDLLALPNVRHLGPKAFTDVPTYMANMDVNVMCYRLEGGWWQAGYPLKMHEYLAVGKPVVGTALPTIRPFGNVIDIVADIDQWLTALRRALEQGGIGTPEERRAVAQENSWDSRLDVLDGWMREVISP